MADSIFCSSNENENAEMRKYFSSLPKFVQENIRQCGMEIYSKQVLQSCAENLLRRN